jgi:molecular chaperone GrpE
MADNNKKNGAHSTAGGPSATAEELQVSIATETEIADHPAPEQPTAAQIAELQAKVASLEEGLLRSRADFQNLQRRTASERSEAIRYANADIIRSLLNVVDDLERTVLAADQGQDFKAVGAGARLALENFMKALREHGVEPILAADQKFDPNIHNALMRQPSSQHPAGTVLQQVAKGFRLRDRVLRPASVVVSMGTEPTEEASSAEELRQA